jgi:hypothetical protein
MASIKKQNARNFNTVAQNMPEDRETDFFESVYLLSVYRQYLINL